MNANESNSGALSLMNVTAGRSQVQFPSLAKLRKYLPEHHVEVGAYSSALFDLGLDIGRYGENQRGSLPLGTVLGELDELAFCLLALAAPPAETDATIYERREVGSWTVPTIEFISPTRRSLGLQVAGEIVNEFTGNTSKKKDWKRRLTSEVKLQRGNESWKSNADYAISLSLRFHPGCHGGSTQNLDVENYIKPIIDAIAAGLFCDEQTDPFAIERFCFDDSNFRLRSGCQWNRLPKELGDDSTIHRTFQRWVELGVLRRIWGALVEQCEELGGVDWEWQAADGAMGKARLGGT